jgi:hypothetical protein
VLFRADQEQPDSHWPEGGRDVLKQVREHGVAAQQLLRLHGGQDDQNVRHVVKRLAALHAGTRLRASLLLPLDAYETV